MIDKEVKLMNNVIYFETKQDMPKKYYANDAGVDLKAGENKVIKNFEVATIETNVSVELKVDTFGYITGRSSFNKNAILCLNGTIDSGYRGKVKINLLNLSGKDLEIQEGERIAQMLLIKRDKDVIWELGKAPQNSERGSNGFGSTGI
jgi:dUTP pyrophosphatase